MIVRDEARCLDAAWRRAACVDEMLCSTPARRCHAGASRAPRARVVPSHGATTSRGTQRGAGADRRDWRLVLDADEWLAPAPIAAGVARAGAADFIGQISVASLRRAQGGVGDAPSWLPRALPRGVRYRGRIHEQPQSSLPRRRLELACARRLPRAQKAKKAGRNEQLLALALASRPTTPICTTSSARTASCAAPSHRRALL